MKQRSFAAHEFAKNLKVEKPKMMRRERFLQEMDAVVPWARLEGVIDPHDPKAGKGRRPYALSAMLRIHFVQQWFGYSGAAMEEALHEVPLPRRFAGLDAGCDTMPDECTILHFRHLLERHQLSGPMFAEVNALLTERGLLLREGTTVDATLIAAPPSTKNRMPGSEPLDPFQACLHVVRPLAQTPPSIGFDHQPAPALRQRQGRQW